MNEIITYTSYQEYKRELDGQLQKTAESFVRIGYLLKVARDTNILAESGYKTVTEFAQAEYGIDKTQVSRFININDRFSENGYSEQLQEQYRSFGYAKLSLMLQIPESITSELTPDYTKAEIQEIKDEIDAEKKISDIEVLCETPDKTKFELNTMPEMAVYQLGMEQQELYEALYHLVEVGEYTDRQLCDVIAPSGNAVYSVRVPAVGRMSMIIAGPEREIKVINVRTGEKEAFQWQQMQEIVGKILWIQPEGVKKSYEEYYAMPWTLEKPEVAPVQPEDTREMSWKVQNTEQKRTELKAEPKKEQKKLSRVIKSKKPEEKKPEPVKTDKPESGRDTEPVQEEHQTAEGQAKGQKTMEQTVGQDTNGQDVTGQDVPGQMDIDTDMPEYAPTRTTWELEQLAEKLIDAAKARDFYRARKHLDAIGRELDYMEQDGQTEESEETEESKETEESEETEDCGEDTEDDEYSYEESEDDE